MLFQIYTSTDLSWTKKARRKRQISLRKRKAYLKVMKTEMGRKGKKKETMMKRTQSGNNRSWFSRNNTMVKLNLQIMNLEFTYH